MGFTINKKKTEEVLYYYVHVSYRRVMHRVGCVQDPEIRTGGLGDRLQVVPFLETASVAIYVEFPFDRSLC